jgi:hypothetical protein
MVMLHDYLLVCPKYSCPSENHLIHSRLEEIPRI